MRALTASAMLMLVLVASGCGDDGATVSGGPGGSTASGPDSSKPTVEASDEVTCEEIERFATVVTDVGITYDYSASRSPAALAGTADVVFGATLNGVVSDVTTDGQDYLAYEADVTRVVMGEVSVGDRVQVLVSYNSAQYDLERYADSVRPGIDVAVFAHRHAPVQGWVASIEGFMVACDDGPLLGWTGFQDGWSDLTTLDKVLDAARSGGLDGPVVFSALPPGKGADEALIEGTLVREGDCLYVAAVDDPASDPSVPRYLVLWPHGTWWESALETVFVSYRTPVAVGDTISAGGGYTSDPTTFDLPPSALAHLTDCLDDPSAEVAYIQTVTSP